MLPIGKEHVAGAFHGNPVALLFLPELGRRTQFAFGQIFHNLVQFVYFPNLRGFEGVQAGDTPFDAVHQLIDRAGNMARHQNHHHQAHQGAEQNDDQNAAVELIAQGEDGILRYKAAEHPVLAFIGDIAAVEIHGGTDTVYPLTADFAARHPLQLGIGGILQSKYLSVTLDDIVKRSQTGYDPVAAIVLFQGHGIARVLIPVQIPG